MKLFSPAVLITVFGTCALAQQEFLRRLPSCAVECLSSTLPMSTCSPDDFSCLCADANFMATTDACNAANCSVVQRLSAINETYAACGIPIRDQTIAMIAPVASLGSLAILMVIIRLVDRSLSSQTHLGWDDLLIALSGLLSIAMNVPVAVAGSLGFGRDMWGIPPDNITLSLKWLYVAYFMYMLSEALCQLSILAFYLRIMVERNSRIAVWTLVAVVTCFGISNTFAMIFQCTPVPFFWDGWRGEMEGYCGVDTRTFGFARGAIEIFLDLAILILPLPMLSKLNMSKKKKAQIMSMFCVGFIITVVSCLRLQAFVQFAHTANPTYDNVSGLYWCATECNLFIVVACMPAMHAILKKLFKRYRDASNYGSNVPNKGSYLRHNNAEHSKRSGSLPFGVISKSTEVDVYRTGQSESDVELVSQDRPNKSDKSDKSDT